MLIVVVSLTWREYWSERRKKWEEALHGTVRRTRKLERNVSSGKGDILSFFWSSSVPFSFCLGLFFEVRASFPLLLVLAALFRLCFPEGIGWLTTHWGLLIIHWQQRALHLTINSFVAALNEEALSRRSAVYLHGSIIDWQRVDLNFPRWHANAKSNGGKRMAAKKMRYRQKRWVMRPFIKQGLISLLLPFPPQGKSLPIFAVESISIHFSFTTTYMKPSRGASRTLLPSWVRFQAKLPSPFIQFSDFRLELLPLLFGGIPRRSSNENQTQREWSSWE